MSTTELAIQRRTDPEPREAVTILSQWKAGREAERRQMQRSARARRPVFVSVRGYDAAKNDNMTFGWTSSSASANEDVRQALDTVRARSRDLAANNDYMRKFLRMVDLNVVGPNGFTYKNLAVSNGQPDTAARDLIGLHYAKWSKRGCCEITGRYSLSGLMKQVARACARDGEYLLRIIRGRAAGNPYGYALQLLDIDRLDTRFNGVHTNGNRLIMGVEVDAIGKPVAYHLHTKHPRDWSYIDKQGRTIERVPATDILHGGIAERPEQVRFMPWATTAMLGLEMLGKFKTAAVAAARKGAETFGVLEQSPDADPNINPLTDSGSADGDEDDEGDEGERYQTSLPGQWDTLPPGYKMSKYESAYPDTLFGPFVKDALRGSASGLNVAYNGLANDLEGVNLSSIRAGMLDERDNWTDLQSFFIEGVLDPVHDGWLDVALLAGAITYPNGNALPALKADQFMPHQFTGRRWAWIDPAKEQAANEAAVKNGSKSRTQVAAEQGRDFYDVVDEIAQENEYAASKKVVLGDAAPSQPEPVQDQGEQDDGKARLLAIAADAERVLVELRATLAARAHEPAPIHFHQAEQRNEIHNHVPPAPPPVVEVRNEITTPAPTVEVRNEITTPAPEVHNHVTVQPSEVTVVDSHPVRAVQTVESDGEGNLLRTVTTYEKDAGGT